MLNSTGKCGSFIHRIWVECVLVFSTFFHCLQLSGSVIKHLYVNVCKVPTKFMKLWQIVPWGYIIYSPSSYFQANPLESVTTNMFFLAAYSNWKDQHFPNTPLLMYLYDKMTKLIFSIVGLVLENEYSFRKQCFFSHWTFGLGLVRWSL